jgi:thiol:disulfide interchange protein DsbD
MPRPLRADSVRRLLRRLRASVAAAVALVGPVLLVTHIGTAGAELKLLPPEQAFRLSARALDTRTLEASFVIANGYYLYRDKLRFALETDGRQLQAASLPPGKLKDDEFFGRVETYRDRIVVRLPMTEPAAGQSVTLRTESQGCADAGVCYPPTVQRLTLAVPASDGRPGPLVDATPAKKSWFK